MDDVSRTDTGDGGEDGGEPVAFTPREREMIAEGLADVAAGRLVPWEEVEAWIDSLGTDNKMPPPYPR